MDNKIPYRHYKQKKLFKTVKFSVKILPKVSFFLVVSRKSPIISLSSMENENERLLDDFLSVHNSAVSLRKLFEKIKIITFF